MCEVDMTASASEASDASRPRAQRQPCGLPFWIQGAHDVFCLLSIGASRPIRQKTPCRSVRRRPGRAPSAGAGPSTDREQRRRPEVVGFRTLPDPRHKCSNRRSDIPTERGCEAEDNDMIDQSPIPTRNLQPMRPDTSCTDSVPGNPEALPEGAKLPDVPPVIHTFYASTAPPPDVVAEWSGECLCPSTTDDDGLHLHQPAQSNRRRNSVTAVLTYVLGLGRFRLWHRGGGIGDDVHRVCVKRLKNHGDE